MPNHAKKAKATEPEQEAYMPEQAYDALKYELERLKENQENHFTYMDLAKCAGISRSTLYAWLKAKTLPLAHAQTLIDAANMLLKQNGRKEAFNFTAAGKYKLDAQREQVSEAMGKSLQQLIELIKDDARSMKELEKRAWELYRARFPQCPEFFNFDPPNSPEGFDAAMEAAEAERSKHIKAEELHEQAAIIAGIRPANENTIEPAYPNTWEPWEQYSEERMRHYELNPLESWAHMFPPDKQDTAQYRKLLKYIDWLGSVNNTV